MISTGVLDPLECIMPRVSASLLCETVVVVVVSADS